MTAPVRLDGMPTEERNPRSLHLDELEVDELVEVISGEDRYALEAVERARPQIAALVRLGVESLAGGGTIHYVGSGTSGRLGVLDAVELVPTYNVGPELVTAHLAGGPGAFLKAVEGAEDDEQAGRELAAGFRAGDLVVGLAASGRTPYVRGALLGAAEVGARTGVVAANPRAPLAELADVAVLLETGPEVVTGSTRMKAATAQKMVINTFSTAVMVRCGRTYSNLMIEVLTTNEKLRARAVRMLEQASGRPEADCRAALTEALTIHREGGPSAIKIALVALLAGSAVPAAAEAAARFPADPSRAGDPSGVRAAVASLG
ncbi:N-acetylmuramic acid 6-phosphate etherase [Desertihabitans brevis]|uniref:N-acetylmuramic acid 6-phosphate etherase n=1 Tax=Desertihabitans brevis TaxID=2268447 RepID=A0A367YX14_9ACTN|nr:N-acetylmuramic acid 6-phosphate etherase [Desertihabitans brevis]RCK70370.1 N-acetylmuramic acid 6-phosphate etherase [Desertihabitans brevis]